MTDLPDFPSSSAAPEHLLQQRALHLALPRKDLEGESTQVVLRVKTPLEEYALPAHQVEMVRPLPPITPLPGVGPLVSGIISLQGHLLTVLDFSVLLGGHVDDQAGYIVVYQTQGQRVALRVREVLEVQDIPLQLPPPSHRRPGVVGVWQARTTVLDLQPLLQEQLNHSETNGGTDGSL